jgi:ferredoxin
MITVTHQRAKCIGCNYCVELAPDYWRMSKKDGKAVLLGAVDKKGFYSLRMRDDEADVNLKAAKVCPVNIIKIR